MKAGLFRAYSSYIESGISWLGQIPAHWEVWKAGHLLSLRSGETLSSEQIDVDGPYPVYGGNGLRGFYTKQNHQGSYILVGRQGALCGNINYANGKFWATEHALVVYPQRDLNITWLGETLRHMNLNQYSVSAAQPGLSVSNITCLRIPVPPKTEQDAIANFLDYETAKIDALIEKQQQLIALLKEKRQAVISNAVTKGLNPDAPMRDSGVEWLGEVPVHWTATTLKHHARVIDCKHVTADFVDEGIPLASIGEVKGWHVDLTSAKKTTEKYYKALIEGDRQPIPGDIIYTRNATVGEAALVDAAAPTFAMGQDVCLIRPDKAVTTEFLLHCLKSPVVATQVELAMVGSTFKRINVDDIRNFSLTLPPTSEQAAIVLALSKKLPRYEALIDKAESTVSLMQERRTALISAAVTGKIDVRGWRPPESATEPNRRLG